VEAPLLKGRYRCHPKDGIMSEVKFADLFRAELENLHDAENQILEALPKMIAAASSAELAVAFEEHLERTREQVKRLDRIFEAMGEQPGGKASEGMQGLIREGETVISGIEKSPVRDVALTEAAQKVEHYQISGYGTVRTLAEMLGLSDAADLLEETLNEEKSADEILTEIAEGIMTSEEPDDEEEDEEEEEEDEEEEVES
jgi:ferritin-like metal-binding protein YciE